MSLPIIIGIVVIILIAIAVTIFLNKEKLCNSVSFAKNLSMCKGSAPAPTTTPAPAPGPTTTPTQAPAVDAYDTLSDSIGNKISDL
jgi:hypothetical protein